MHSAGKQFTAAYAVRVILAAGFLFLLGLFALPAPGQTMVRDDVPYSTLMWSDTDPYGFQTLSNAHTLAGAALPSNSLPAILAGYEPHLPPAPPNNPAAYYLNANREFAPISIGAGGYGGNLYFLPEASTNAGYMRLSYGAGAVSSNLSVNLTAGTTVLRSYLFDDTVNTGIIDAGMWTASFYARATQTGNPAVRLILTVFMYRPGGTVTNLFTATSDAIVNSGFLTLKKETSQPLFVVDPAWRIGAVVSASTDKATTLVTSVGDGNGSYFTTPLRIRHSQLRGFNDDPAYRHITSQEKAAYDSVTNLNVYAVPVSGGKHQLWMKE